MKRNRSKYGLMPSLILVLIFICALSAHASDKKIEVGIDEQLGKSFPLNLYFNGEDSNKVLLRDLVNNRPTILAFVYYECPGICNPLMAELAYNVDKIDLEPAKDFQIITISIDELETPAQASSKKAEYLKSFKRKFPPSAWRFLTGDSAAIKQAADAAGWYFKRSGKEFLHAGSIIFLSPNGKITRYLFGLKFLPFDIKMALLEASKGEATPTIAKVLQFCFSYDPEGRTYVLNLTRIIGAGMLVLAAIFVAFLTLKPKKKSQ